MYYEILLFQNTDFLELLPVKKALTFDYTVKPRLSEMRGTKAFQLTGVP